MIEYGVPNGVVGTSADDELITILEAGNTPFVPVQRPNEFARLSAPDLDGAVARRGNDVLLIEVDNVHCRSVTD